MSKTTAEKMIALEAELLRREVFDFRQKIAPALAIIRDAIQRYAGTHTTHDGRTLLVKASGSDEQPANEQFARFLLGLVPMYRETGMAVANEHDMPEPPAFLLPLMLEAAVNRHLSEVTYFYQATGQDPKPDDRPASDDTLAQGIPAQFVAVFVDLAGHRSPAAANYQDMKSPNQTWEELIAEVFFAGSELMRVVGTAVYDDWEVRLDRCVGEYVEWRRNKGWEGTRLISDLFKSHLAY